MHQLVWSPYYHFLSLSVRTWVSGANCRLCLVFHSARIYSKNEVFHWSLNNNSNNNWHFLTICYSTLRMASFRVNPRRHKGGGGGWGQSDLTPSPDFFGFKTFVLWPITKCFGTTVLRLLRHLLTLIKWRHDWWRHHNNSRNWCVDYENAIFC